MPAALLSRLTVRVWLAIALLALVAMGLNSPVVESVTFRPIDNSASAETVNAPYIRPVNTGQDVVITLYSRGYGNTTLRLTPRYCLSGGFKINGVQHPFPDKQDKWCQQLMVDLSGQLQPGNNTLETTTLPASPANKYSPNVGLAIGSPLFGYHFAQSFFTVIFLASLAVLLWQRLAGSGFTLGQRLLYFAACGLSLQWLYVIPQFAYTLDLEKHLPYIQFLSDHPFSLFDYPGPENWHPFLYYWLAAMVARSLQFLGVFDAFTGIRLLSMLCYLVFLYFGMRTILRLVKGPACYVALGLLLFWPSGLFNAGWVFNDVLIYPLYAAVFYYALVWYEDDKSCALALAVAACGIAFMVKSSALVPTGILGLCMAAKFLVERSGLRSLIDRPMGIAWALVVAGASLGWLKIAYFKWVLHQSPPGFLLFGGGFPVKPDQFLLVNLENLFSHPMFTSWEETPLWNLQIKTMLFTNSDWRYPGIATSLIALYLLMLVYSVAFLVTLPRNRGIALFPLWVGWVVPFAASVAFTIITRMGSCMDFRYVQPALVAVAAVFLLAVQEAQRKGWPVLYYGGLAAGLLFSVLSVVFFELQLA